jgi:hypothetical protein
MAGVSDNLKNRPELTAFIHDPMKLGINGRALGSILNETNLRRVLAIMLDEKEFLSDFGIRAISRIHKDHPTFTEWGTRNTRCLIFQGNRTMACSGATPTGEDPSGCPSIS